jgi:hypothetical protein
MDKKVINDNIYIYIYHYRMNVDPVNLILFSLGITIIGGTVGYLVYKIVQTNHENLLDDTCIHDDLISEAGSFV